MLPETGVSFASADEGLQKVYDEAEKKCRLNLKSFGGDPVLVEGGGYEKIWLETQPMGGEMYALRDLRSAVNNCLLFMRFQREDGRLPGSIKWENGKLTPEYNKFQGFCFPFPALNLYYLLGQDKEYLSQVKDCLIRFDAYLWRARSQGNDGLLRSFCIYDTGEDGALRYGDAPCWWTEETPPEGYQVVPMASMDVTSWSYACRDALARIYRIEGNEERAGDWAKKAAQVAESIRRGLWDEQRGACYDRDKSGKTVDILCHSTLRCMYFGSVSQDMANRFVQAHLLNPREFWTPFPLPSVAACDPAFRNAPENNWSGQPEGLTYQRSILALENYGYHGLVTQLGNKLITAVRENGCRFTQQFDPFTGKPSLVHAVTHQPVTSPADPIQDAYGPTMLSVLEFIAHRFGIHPHLGRIWFSLGTGPDYEYRAQCLNHRYEILARGKQAEIRVDGNKVYAGSRGVRIIGDQLGKTLSILSME